MQTPADKFELEVPLQDFLVFLKESKYGAKLGKRNISREEVEFRFSGADLIVTVVGVNHSIPASGSWKGMVTIALPFIGGLRKAPPSQNPLRISYADSKLKIGTTAFPAKWAE